MKYIILIQAVLFAFIFSPASGQNDGWDTYIAKFGDKPGSVLVDMGLINTAPDKRYPYLVITGPQVHKCNADGLPDKEEIDQLEEILSATDNFLTGVTAKMLTGTFSYNCERLNYYYVKDTVGIRNALMRMYRRSYPDYSYVINMKKDQEWVTYRTLLYPDEKVKNWMENDKVITKMMQDGDSLTGQRDISFDLYFKTDTDRTAFASYAGTHGFDVTVPNSDPVSKGTQMPYELTISKYSYVKMDGMVAMTEEIKQQVRQHHGVYGGWIAPLNKEQKK